MMYKYANNVLPLAINDLLTTNSDVHNYTTRQNHLLYVNKSNINIYSKVLATQVCFVLLFKVQYPMYIEIRVQCSHMECYAVRI